MRIVVLNDGETFSNIEGCTIVELKGKALKYFDAAPDQGKFIKEMLRPELGAEKIDGVTITVIE